MMSDTKKDNLYASSTENLLSSREDYECAQAERGKVYEKGFRAQKYLERHNPQFAGWMPTDNMTNFGDLFFTAIRQDTLFVADTVQVGEVEVIVEISYKNYKYAAL